MNFNIHIQKKMLPYLLLIALPISLRGGRDWHGKTVVINDTVVIERPHKKIPIVFEYYIGESNNPHIFSRKPMQHTTAKLTYKHTDFADDTHPVSFYTQKCHLITRTKNKDKFIIKPLKGGGVVIHNTTRGFSTRIFNSTI